MKYIYIVAIVLASLLGFLGGRFYQGRQSPQLLTGTGISGWFGVYNSSAITLKNGQASSAAVDVYGQLKISPSSTITLIGE